MGPEVFELEEKLADYCGVKHAISCSSGTDALLIPLMAWGIGPGDAVFTTPFTYVATAEVIALLGATPVFVDVYDSTFNIDCEKLEIAIKDIIKGGDLQPKAIIPVDLFGVPARYRLIDTIAKKYHLKVIEDAAQSFGGSIRDRKVGSFGDVAATSFYPAKPLGCYGDGGAIFTNNDDAYETAITLHNKGVKVKSIIDIREKSDGTLPKKCNELGIKIYWKSAVIYTEGYKKINKIHVMRLSKDNTNVVGNKLKIDLEQLLCLFNYQLVQKTIFQE